LSLKLTNKKVSKAQGAKSPSLTAIPKCDLHFILHYLVMQQIKARNNSTSVLSYPSGRHRYFLIQYYKSFQLVSRLKGAALCDLKTQYAKKKRNPE